VLAGGLLLLVACFLRRNPLAWVTAAWLGVGGAGALRLMLEPGGAYRLQGALALAVVLVPLAWLALSARGPTEGTPPRSRLGVRIPSQ
jgi:hypothetical protein